MSRSLDLWRAPGHLIRRAQQLHNATWSEEVGKTVTPVQFALINTLRDEPGLDQRSVGERIGTDRSTTADVAERLERRGLITQTRDPEDRRRRLLELTQSGGHLHAKLMPMVEQVEKKLFTGLTVKEQDTVLTLLGHIVTSTGDAINSKPDPRTS